MPDHAEKSSIINIASHLPDMAGRQPEVMALAVPRGRGPQGEVIYSRYTFRELNEESNRMAWGLEGIGIERGTRTVLMVKPGVEFFALTFALFKIGAVPVLVDPGMGLANLKECLAQAEPEAFIGTTKAHAARTLLRWAEKTIRTKVTVGPRLFWGGDTLKNVREQGKSQAPYEMARTSPDEVAAILFTSGSTGPPKGAVYTHGNFAAQVEALRLLYRIEPGEIDLPTFPLFALFDPALGMSAVLPEMDATRPALVDPKNIIEPVQRFGVTNLFGSPALIRRVGQYGEEKKIVLPSLKRVISAGAPVHADALERFARMLPPGAQIFTPYGATEALPVSSIGSDEILKETRWMTEKGAGVCVGRPVNGAELSIVPITDEPIEKWAEELQLPPGEMGEIVVRGPMVTREYYQRPESTRLAKIPGTNPGEFHHRMGDVGYRDREGRLWFCGRKAQRVGTKEGTLFTIPVEGVFNAHEDVFRSALVGVGANGAKRPVLCVELEKGVRGKDLKKIRDELLELGSSRPHTRSIQTILFHPGFPVDSRHNAKIFREKLAVWAARQLGERASLNFSQTFGQKFVRN